MNKKRPVIGVTLDHEAGGTHNSPAWSSWPWYAVRANYMDAIAASGGVPVALPHMPRLASSMLDAIDALVVTGGAFDIDPALYGVDHAHASVTLKPVRTAAEVALMVGALERDIPILGICGGEQLLAVVLGGSLIQHIPDEVVDPLPHEQPNPRDEAGHVIEISPGTLLSRVTQTRFMAVNSSHHQSVRDPGRGIVCARAEDSVIEAIEDPRARFCLGVQWHPEFCIDGGDRRIFDALIAAAGE